MSHSFGLIGYGEVGKIFAQAFAQEGARVFAWDVKFAQPEHAARERAHATATGITVCDSAQALCAAADIVVSAVTASNTLVVAQEAAPHLRARSFFLDLNSASPGTKQAAAALIDATGAHYVEAGVMTSVPPYGIKVPMLLGGTQAESLLALLLPFGVDAKVVSKQIGIASATKMSRSIMIKGLEALVIESFTNARAYGVEDAMLATLKETFPSIDWEQQGAYFFMRVAQHGKRRAEEMREAANTVRETGIAPLMTAAIPEKHDWIARRAAAGMFTGLDKNADWRAYADRLVADAKKSSR